MGPGARASCQSVYSSWNGLAGHRRRSSVNCREHKIFAREICIKNQQNARILHVSCRKIIKIPEFLIFAWKFYKIPEFYMVFARKMPEFYLISARKIFFPNFRGGREHVPPCLCLCSWIRRGNKGDKERTCGKEVSKRKEQSASPHSSRKAVIRNHG